MKFNKLRLLGFKSFVEPTEFIIGSGLTGVVGPNGCGKSNLVEALRWVMGENSYKNMRASGMDDVIFSGSKNRPARNTGEVSLFLDNADRTAPAAFNDTDELQVTRRIEREAGSVYRINGKDVRAKDVQLLFADASTGARSPSMVGQGRIGELVSAKPQARRALLEEAAGISGLHSRRHEAELRLRAAETNLERLDDVIGQLDTQLESLKRQARQANRYRALSQELRQAHALLFHLKWTAAKEAEGEAKSAVSDANMALAQKAELQVESAKNEAVAGSKLPELRDKEVACAAVVQRLSIAKAQLEEEVLRLKNRREELQNRLAQLNEDLGREERLAQENADTAERLSAERDELIAQGEQVEETREQAENTMRIANEKLVSSEAVLAQLTERYASQKANRSGLEKTLLDASNRKASLEQQFGAVTEELGTLLKAISEMAAPAIKQEDVNKSEASVQEAEGALAAAEEAVRIAREQEAQLREPVEQAQGKLRELETEARTLRKIVNHVGQELFPAIIEQIEIEPGYETALGAAFGEDLDVPTDNSAAVYWGGTANGEDDPALPNGARPMSELTRAPAELSRRLAQIGIVDESEGSTLSKQLKTGQMLVSTAGSLWRWDGFVAGSDAPSAAALKLAQKNRLSELEHLCTEAQTQVEKAQADFDQGKEETARKQIVQHDTREALQAQRLELSKAREALVEAERSVSRLATRRSALEEASSRLERDTQEIELVISETTNAIENLADVAELETELEANRLAVAQDRAALAEARAAFEGLSREAMIRKNRLESIGRELNNWGERTSNSAKQIETLKARQCETIAALEELSDAPDQLDEKRRKLMDELDAAELARTAAANTLAEAETLHNNLGKAAKLAAEGLAEAREKLGRSEERLVAAGQRREEIETRIREEIECKPSDALSLSGLEPGDELPEAHATEMRFERLRQERDRLGAVNLRAQEEQTEIDERRTDLVTEREDLTQAISKLRSGIQSLNKEGRERLLEAFEVVDQQFTRLFTHLFGGGSAKLELVESDDPLEAGLEIIANPPGKKPQTLTLLSGGEQALTAMALIFAVFLTNPAPICVLDEVDAPLDDHNVERFCNLMDEMAQTTETRFVLITHNPITMARMDRMFGVTMAEQGVSQLVSVNLQEAEELRDAG